MPRPSIVLGDGKCNDNILTELISIRINTRSIFIFNRNNIPFIESVQEEEEEKSIELPLPDPKEFFQESFNLAFPEILAWSAAATGILLVVLIVKSFTK